MKDRDNSKMLLALLGGVAIGVIIGYMLNSDKKGGIIENLKDTASDLSDELAEEIERGKSVIEDLKHTVGDRFKKATR